jgi:hypothetical protein
MLCKSQYALCWRIETYHKILKSGCRAEDVKLRTAERLVKLLAVFCILGWRIFWLTMMRRTTNRAAPSLAFTPLEIELLARTVEDGPKRTHPRLLNHCLMQLARLGGYLNRAGDRPPGNTVMWRGLTRLTDIAIGYELGRDNCG